MNGMSWKKGFILTVEHFDLFRDTAYYYNFVYRQIVHRSVMMHYLNSSAMKLSSKYDNI